MLNRTQVVVVGGGGAGVPLVRSLSASLDPIKYNLTLINSRPYHIFLIATARIVVSEQQKLEDSAFIPYDRIFHNGNGTFVQGTVTAIKAGKKTGGQVVLGDGVEIPYDILVLAPGSLWPGPLAFPDDPQEVSTFIESTRTKLQSAKHVVLAGGGAVGIEMAGEIKDIWPDKKVTIVQAGAQLLNNTYPDRFRRAAASSVRNRGVDIIFGDYIDHFPEEGKVTGVTTRNGKTLDADLVISTRGPRPNTAFISSLSPNVLTVNGFVKVKPTLQLEGYSNIFAAGDVIDFPEQKQVAKAQAHASVIAANVLRLCEGRTLKEYKGSPELIVVTNGKNGGVGYFGILWGIMIGNWLSSLIKSKNLMVSRAQGMAGY